MKRSKCLLIVLVLVTTLFSTHSFTAFASHSPPSTNSNQIVSTWIEKKIILGYPNGDFQLDQPMTRAELATIICRLFGFSYVNDTVVISDISPNKWYSPSIYRIISQNIMPYDALGERYFFHPTSFITHSQALEYLSKAYHVDIKQLLNFNRTSSNDLLSRLDAIMLIEKLTQGLINQPGIYTEDVEGNLIINTSNVTLKNMVISGNLYLAEGINLGSITLDNTYIKGTVYVNGCGEHSLIIKGNTVIESMIVENKISTVRLVAGSENVIKQLSLLTPTILDGPIILSDAESAQYAIYAPSPNTLISSHRSSGNPPSSDSTLPPNNPPSSDDNLPPSNPPPPDDNLPPNNPSPPDDNTDIENPNPVPNNPGHAPVDPPSNISINFKDYPNTAISWDCNPSATSYDFKISNLQNPNDSFSIQVLEPHIRLDGSEYLVLLDNHYTLSIIAHYENTTVSSEATLAMPSFYLQEADNGFLEIDIALTPLNTIRISHLVLGIYQENHPPDELEEHQVDLTQPLCVLSFNETLTNPYFTPVYPKNDTTYALKIIASSSSPDEAYSFDNYTATYFANASCHDIVNAITSAGKNASTPITLTSVRHLRNLSSFVSKGNATLNKYFKLLNDLDFANPLENASSTISNFIPIGIKTDAVSKGITSPHLAFNGNFDGGGHTIYNMKIKSVSNDSSIYVYAALFAVSTGSVQNITLDESCTIDAQNTPYFRHSFSSGIVAFAASRSQTPLQFSNCYNYASISSAYHSSGIIGCIYVENNHSVLVENCYNFGPVIGLGDTSGIVNSLNFGSSPTANVSIRNCSNWGNIMGISCASGILGNTLGKGNASIIKSANFGLITTDNWDSEASILVAAGIFAYNDNVNFYIEECINGGAIYTNAKRAASTAKAFSGGIMGRFSDEPPHLYNNYNYGSVFNIHSATHQNNSGNISAVFIRSDYIADCFITEYLKSNSPDTSKNIIILSCHEFLESIKQRLAYLPQETMLIISDHIFSHCMDCIENNNDLKEDKILPLAVDLPENIEPEYKSNLEQDKLEEESINLTPVNHERDDIPSTSNPTLNNITLESINPPDDAVLDF